MPGKIRGFFFKTLIGALLEGTVETLFKETKKKVAEMRNEEWYDWDEFQNIALRLGKTLGDLTTKAVGRRIIVQSKSVYLEQGYQTLEALLQGYPAMFNANIQDVPAEQQVRLVEFSPGHVIYHYPSGQPQALIAGYFSGFFKIYDKNMLSIQFEKRDTRYVIDIKW